jgi:hypothetical protein
VAYRDDLEAAIAHADAAERELANARRELAADHERIAELERELEAAKRRRDKADKRAAAATERAAKRDPERTSPAAAPRDPAKPTWLRAALLWGGILAGIVALSVGVPWLVRARDIPTKSVVDLVADEPAARALAQKQLPDPALYEIRADYVDPGGRCDLEQYGGDVNFKYLSPSRAAVPAPAPTGPIGAPQPTTSWPTCSVEVRYQRSRTRTYWTNGRGEQCGQPLPSPPRCTVVDVWNEAIRRGAPVNALASIRLQMRTRQKRDRPTWSFQINGPQGRVFEMELFDDECPWSSVPAVLKR